uniref:Nif3-like dinuclear metal center hexameric protein n=1 Tax=Flavobacterium sp. TaxID=239 RepID=UPI0040491611
MLLKEFCAQLDAIWPLAYAETYDNVGLLVGDSNAEVKGVLVCHDALEACVDEAIQKNCNVVVCFHPILFSGLKKITGKSYVEKVVIKAIKNDVAIFAIHTALDNHPQGVNKIICDKMGFTESKVLIPKEQFIKKLVTFTPAENFESLRNALFEVGAGNIGNYDRCSFSLEGIGTYRGGEDSNPVVGAKHEFMQGKEMKLEVLYEKHLESRVLKTLFENHIYEEVAHDIYTLDNKHQNIGLGRIGFLPEPMDEIDFLKQVKETFGCGIIRHSAFLGKKIQKVAVLGGSGASAIQQAIQQGADAYLTADLKYHDFYSAENQMLLCDIGHFESERFTKNYIVEILTKNFPNFAIILSEQNTNPVKYF